jgi:hypothetical protein
MSIFNYKDERNFLCHELWLQLNCIILCYYITLLSDGDVLTHIKVIDNLTFHFMCQAQSDI